MHKGYYCDLTLKERQIMFESTKIINCDISLHSMNYDSQFSVRV